jgi:hypothetical protein
MLTYKKNSLLALLAQFKAKLYEFAEQDGAMLEFSTEYQKAGETILRNLISIEKQIKKL